MSTVTIDQTYDKKVIRQKVAKPMLWLGIFSMIMLFAGLTSAYVVSRAGSEWVSFDLPKMFTLSTIVILISSGTMYWALLASKKNNYGQIKIAMLTTLGLALIFVYTQFSAWGELVDQGVFFGGSDSIASGSYLYVLSGLHLLHLAGGIIMLTYTSFKALKERYKATDNLGLQLSSIYWHFLDILWIYLFLFLYFIR